MKSPIQARYYILGLFLIASLLLTLLGQYLYLKGDKIQQEVQQQAHEQASNELKKSLAHIFELVNSEAAALANWDEIHLQFAQPSYYYYWHSQRLQTSDFFKPYYLELELYDKNRQKFSSTSERYLDLPEKLTLQPANIKKYIQVQPPRKEILIVSQPVFQRANPAEIDGYIAIAIDFFKLLETEAGFNYLDFEKLFFNRSGIIEPQDLFSALEFQIIPMPVNERLWDLIAKSIFEFFFASLIILVLVLVVAGWIFIWPIHKLSSHLKRLTTTNTTINSAPNYLVTEFTGLHNQLTDYHNELLSSKAKMAEKNQQLWNLLRQDSLTGLANIRALEEFWQIISEEVQEHPFDISYLIFDCDQFSFYNKNYSHQIGDQIIIETAGILQKVFNSTSIYRVGIDRFVVILTNTSLAQVEQLANRSLQQIASHPFEKLGILEKVSFSIGISHMPAKETKNHLEVLAKQAQIAVFKAKQQISNRLNFYQAPDENNSINKSQLTVILDSIYHKDNIKLYFQPIFDLNKNHVFYKSSIKIQAEDNLVDYLDIYPIIKQHHLEEKFDSVFLEKLLEKLQTTSLDNIKAVSIKLSTKTLLQPYLIDLFEPFLGYLKQINIIIELKESIITQHPDLFTFNLNKLRRQGFLIAIEQFAEESTNLMSLPKLPVDFIKLDQKILQLAEDNPINQKFIANFLKMLLATPVKIVVTQVETQYQLDQIFDLLDQEEINKLLVQGSLFGKPEPDLVIENRTRSGCREPS